METSDESFVAGGQKLRKKVLGDKFQTVLDPIGDLFGERALEKRTNTEEDEEERTRTEAASIAEEERTVTSPAVPQSNEIERRNRRRRASVLTRNFDRPALGSAGVLGG